jgi:hypothetical protein
LRLTLGSLKELEFESVKKMSSIEYGNGREGSANGIKVEIIESLTATCEKMKAEKYDSNFEKYVVDWVFTFLEKPREDYPNLHTLLKDGVILCEFVSFFEPLLSSLSSSNAYISHFRSE